MILLRSSTLRLLSTSTCASSSRSDFFTRHMKFNASNFVAEENFEQRARPFFDFETPFPDVFRTSHLSTNLQNSSSAAFGGLIFSQAMAAAEQTVSYDLKPHALHSFFILNVDTSIPVEYHVRRTRDGRSFATRSVEAIQSGKVAFSLQISFHKLEPDSVVHQETMPEVPHWSELAATKSLLPNIIEKVENNELVLPDTVLRRLRFYHSRVGNGDLFEMRPTDPKIHFALTDQHKFSFYNWFRANGDLGNCERLHRYLVAYNTDSALAGAVFRPHFKNEFQPSMIFSLDHIVHIHKHDVRADQWILFETHSHYAGKGRGMSTGRLWTENGQLVATCTQEVLVRTRGEASRL